MTAPALQPTGTAGAGGAAAAGPDGGGSWARTVVTSPSLRLIGRRLLAAIVVLFGVTLLTFVVMNLLPGDSASALLGAGATPAQVHQLEIRLRLNEPFWVRYGQWMGGVIHGDLGSSLSTHQAVTTILGQRLPISFELLLYAIVIAVGFSIAVAVLAARKPGGIADRISMAVAMAGLSIAPYVLAVVLIVVFAVKLGVVPAIGFVPVSQGIGANIRSLTLPAVSLAFALFCFYTRQLRADILEQMQTEDYIVTARAKGVGPWRVLIRHALRNSLFGLITIVGLNVGTLVSALVIIEVIFSVPGIGSVLLTAINDRDVPVVEGTVVVFGFLVVVANLLTDLLYAALDPRIRYGRATT